jgi:hypothetical protein
MSPALQSRSGALGAGQPDAGSMDGGSYQLNGGFWDGAAINFNIYVSLTSKKFLTSIRRSARNAQGAS